MFCKSWPYGKRSILSGRAEIRPLHQRVAELDGMLRSGLECTFCLPDGGRAAGNGVLVDALTACARNAGREVASTAEARMAMGLAATQDGHPVRRHKAPKRLAAE